MSSHLYGFDQEFKNVGKEARRIERLAFGWFIFVLLLTLAIVGGLGYVIFRVLVHFGIM